MPACRAGLHRHFHLLIQILQRQRLDDVVEIAVDDFIEAVKGQIDAVVGKTVLREIIRTDFCAAVAGRNHAFAGGILLRRNLCKMFFIQAGLQHFERFRFILVLRFFILALNDESGWNVHDPYR